MLAIMRVRTHLMQYYWPHYSYKILILWHIDFVKLIIIIMNLL